MSSFARKLAGRSCVSAASVLSAPWLGSPPGGMPRLRAPPGWLPRTVGLAASSSRARDTAVAAEGPLRFVGELQADARSALRTVAGEGASSLSPIAVRNWFCVSPSRPSGERTGRSRSKISREIWRARGSPFSTVGGAIDLTRALNLLGQLSAKTKSRVITSPTISRLKYKTERDEKKDKHGDPRIAGWQLYSFLRNGEETADGRAGEEG